MKVGVSLHSSQFILVFKAIDINKEELHHAVKGYREARRNKIITEIDHLTELTRLISILLLGSRSQYEYSTRRFGRA